MIKQAVFIDRKIDEVINVVKQWAEKTGASVEVIPREERQEDIQIEVSGEICKVRVYEAKERRRIYIAHDKHERVLGRLSFTCATLLYGGGIQHRAMQEMVQYVLDRLGGHWSSEDDGIIFSGRFYHNEVKPARKSAMSLLAKLHFGKERE